MIRTYKNYSGLTTMAERPIGPILICDELANDLSGRGVPRKVSYLRKLGHVS